MSSAMKSSLIFTGVAAGLLLAVAPWARADIIIQNVNRTITTQGNATDAERQLHDSFSQSDSQASWLGAFNSTRSGAANVDTAWATGEVSQDSSVGAASFVASGDGEITAGTVEDFDFQYYSDAAAHSTFEVDFSLTTPYLMDLQGDEWTLWGQGAAMDMGVVSLVGPSINFMFNNENFGISDYLLLPGDYTLEGRVSLIADSPPGQDGGTSGVAEHFSLNCALRSAEVPEPSTLLLLGIGTATLAYRRLRKSA